MTRTVFIGEYSDRQKEIYNIVLEANKRGITEKGFGEYFTHRTGHSIGMECHETGDVSSANDEIIEVGQCFSVEPGIYLYDEGIGVRIEDIVLVTEDGCVTLNNYPKEEMIVVPDGE